VTLAELVATFRRRAVEAASHRPSTPPGAPSRGCLAAIYEAVLAELAPLGANGHAKAPPARLASSTVKEAAVLLGVTPRWLYRHASTPALYQVGWAQFACRLRFDADGLRQVIGRLVEGQGGGVPGRATGASPARVGRTAASLTVSWRAGAGGALACPLAPSGASSRQKGRRSPPPGRLSRLLAASTARRRKVRPARPEVTAPSLMAARATVSGVIPGRHP